MTAVTLVVGAVLTIAGVIGYAVTGFESATALIPSFVGLLMLIAGIIARNVNARRHAIHAALVIALLGALGSLRNVAAIGDVFDGTADRPAAIILSTLMFVVLIGYLVLGIRSFIQARRDRQGESPA